MDPSTLCILAANFDRVHVEIANTLVSFEASIIYRSIRAVAVARELTALACYSMLTGTGPTSIIGCQNH